MTNVKIVGVVSIVVSHVRNVGNALNVHANIVMNLKKMMFNIPKNIMIGIEIDNYGSYT
jgi:hypothetical protein